MSDADVAGTVADPTDVEGDDSGVEVDATGSAVVSTAPVVAGGAVDSDDEDEPPHAAVDAAMRTSDTARHGH